MSRMMSVGVGGWYQWGGGVADRLVLFRRWCVLSLMLLRRWGVSVLLRRWCFFWCC